jgi:GTP-binding protein EngB required for normal cell division
MYIQMIIQKTDKVKKGEKQQQQHSYMAELSEGFKHKSAFIKKLL